MCFIFIYSFSKEKGFIINLNHPEAFELDLPLDYLKSLHKYICKRKNQSFTTPPPPPLYGYTIHILLTKK